MMSRRINYFITKFRNSLRYSSTESSSSQNTVDSKEIKHLQQFSKRWWDRQGEFAPLHAFNPLRIKLIRDGMRNVGYQEVNPSLPLQGLNILDIGCGGGILSESLARVGANVTGVDAAEELINTAKEHAALDPSLGERVTYICTSIEDHVSHHIDFYDAVVASEVLEHVTNKDYFAKCCIDVLKPGGSFFITTVNKTPMSWFVGIILAEYTFKLIPRGTHEWSKFISPLDTQRILEKHGCQTKLKHGVFYNPLKNDWSWISSTSISYVLHAVKLSKSSQP